MNIITESMQSWLSEDYDEYSKELQSFFPAMYTTLKGTVNSLFPTTTKRLPKEEELCKKWFKNLKVEVRLDNDFTRHVGTLPGISTVKDHTIIQWLPFLGKWFHVYKGIDYISIEAYENPGAPVHRALLQAGVLIVEGVHLLEVPPGTYEVFCLPIRIEGADGAPARVLLREHEKEERL